MSDCLTYGPILGIETSCDETAAAVVVNGCEVLSSVVSSQADVHALYGGVVPEIAGRAHLERIIPVVSRAISEARISEHEITAVAATVGPGLVGALLVGVSTAKALSLAWGVPFVAVNHLEAHLQATFLDEPDIELPVVVMLVSGGHTFLVFMEDRLRYKVLGTTVDDAAGEAFDKVARILGLGYPGGPAIDRSSREGEASAITFPRPMFTDGWNFSFSGLKTAVATYMRHHPGAVLEDVAASFQEAVVDVIIAKALNAVSVYGAKGLCLTGGVAANSRLREVARDLCEHKKVAVHLPSLAMCTDNAAMIAATGWWRLKADGPSPLTIGAEPSLPLVV
ncbi:MAG: tRNA (adenosine(37)-N6)-threonylcarbamoyltransferase complex transferase subunit TsaD [Acidimicrobiaceae bacterium]|nr:tRNA (adenosine(37)-N6)-threonylcarbamoyltransferase complex transferase subunit TsaD [Acidimicrobiaceae bacterium]